MKKILTIALISFAGISALSGCTKKSSSPSYSMNATIGGTAFSAAHSVATSSNGFGIIEGWSGTSAAAVAPYVAINLQGYNKTTGTFTLGDMTTGKYIVYYKNSSTLPTTSTNGTVNITSASSSTIVGTFSCTTDDGTVISNGSFTAQGY